MTKKKGKLSIPGALTPTEVITAWDAGADYVKIFPCSAVGGASYLKSLLAPFPHLKLIPTGGVTLQTAESFLRAGARALGVGSDLVNLAAVDAGTPGNHHRDRPRLPKRAGRQFRQISRMHEEARSMTDSDSIRARILRCPTSALPPRWPPRPGHRRRQRHRRGHRQRTRPRRRICLDRRYRHRSRRSAGQSTGSAKALHLDVTSPDSISAALAHARPPRHPRQQCRHRPRWLH